MIARSHDVDGLFVGEWGPVDGEPVVAIHGITSSHLAWAEVAAAAPHLRIIAPDLRGRGASSTLPGPWGMPQHAHDVVAVLDALDLDRAPLIGHSMGGFVANVTASLFPARISGVLLVDGGLTLSFPAGVTIDTAEKLLGPAAERLAMTFESVDDYRAFWKKHPAFADAWSASVEEYVDYDLVDGRSRTSADAMRQDAVELYGTDVVDTAVAGIPFGTTLLTAPRGLQDENPGLYPPAALERWAAALPGLDIVEVSDTNHYTVLMSPRGAAVVAEYAERLTPGI